jgi:nucleoside-diphosphate-sugar epimerase
MERIIDVFGGRGFVGSKFAESRFDVNVKDRGDYEVSEKATEVVYFISTIHNYHVHTDPYIDIDTNLTTLINVLETCKGKDITFNFISSWFVYGNVPLPAKEDSHCDPKGFYSITKRAAEQLLISYCETFGIKYRILRLANVIGATDGKVSAKKNALQFMINEIVEGRDVNMYDGGLVYRDYIHVDDAVKAINLVVDSGNVNEIYNIGNGNKVYIKDVMEMVKLWTNSPSHLKSIETVEFHKKVQTKDMVLDVSKIKDLGYRPSYSLTQMIDSVIPKKS